MLGLMQDRPLTLPHVFHRAEQYFGHKEIVTATPAGTVRTTTVAEWAVRTRRLATVLDTLGVSADGRVGTFCWNTDRHLELYLAVPCTGRVLHTLNLRLFPDQLVYVADHAEDEVVFVERSLLGLFWPHVDRMTTVRHVVVIDDGAPTEIPDDPRIRLYEELLAAAEPFAGRFVVSDENTAAAMCYTSGTTGNPKGVVYSHRSTLLHSLATLFADGVGLCERDVVLPVVPMFHANAWGLPYGCLLAGTSLVLPGPGMTPDAVLTLIQDHGSPSPRASRRSGWACCPSSASTTARRCGSCSAAARRCRSRCRRASAPRSACRSCRDGG
jgi:fatty-acyl-CoA synthase